MCFNAYDQNSTPESLRRKVVVASGSSAAFAAASGLSFTHGHPHIGAAVASIQFCLLTVAIGLLTRMKRRQMP